MLLYIFFALGCFLGLLALGYLSTILRAMLGLLKFTSSWGFHFYVAAAVVHGLGAFALIRYALDAGVFL